MACTQSISLSLLLLLFVLSPAYAQSLTCSTQKLNREYDNCKDLPTLSSYLHWTYNPADNTLLIAFLAPPTGWISWAINPTSTGMAGAQALVAFKDNSDGSMAVNTFNIRSYGSLVEGNLDGLVVKETSAESSDGMMKIYATFVLPESLSSSGKINHVWQVGSSVSGGIPDGHQFDYDNLHSMGTLDLSLSSSSSGVNTTSTYESPSSVADDYWTKLKYIHGVLNAVSWGFLFPVGVIIARYLKTFESADPAWFYLHISCQMLGYALGVAGWATGLRLGSHSEGIVFSTHRLIGIVLFCFATNQIFAIRFRPNKDSKYRLCWTIYHRSVGYAIVILGIINVFEGFNILQPGKNWKLAYIIVLILLACISVLLEAITWSIVLLRRQQKSNNVTHDSLTA